MTLKFKLGQLVITAGAQQVLKEDEIHNALMRHSQGDWGEVCEEDKKTNDHACENGFRLLSAYESSKGIKYWLITEGNRSVTTILLPEEY